jgi:hypothetical protein
MEEKGCRGEGEGGDQSEITKGEVHRAGVVTDGEESRGARGEGEGDSRGFANSGKKGGARRETNVISSTREAKNNPSI